MQLLLLTAPSFIAGMAAVPAALGQGKKGFDIMGIIVLHTTEYGLCCEPKLLEQIRYRVYTTDGTKTNQATTQGHHQIETDMQRRFLEEKYISALAQ